MVCIILLLLVYNDHDSARWFGSLVGKSLTYVLTGLFLFNKHFSACIHVSLLCQSFIFCYVFSFTIYWASVVILAIQRNPGHRFIVQCRRINDMLLHRHRTAIVIVTSVILKWIKCEPSRFLTFVGLKLYFIFSLGTTKQVLYLGTSLVIPWSELAFTHGGSIGLRSELPFLKI